MSFKQFLQSLKLSILHLKDFVDSEELHWIHDLISTIHFFLFLLLFFIGAEISELAVMFLGSLAVYISLSFLSSYLESKKSDREGEVWRLIHGNLSFFIPLSCFSISFCQSVQNGRCFFSQVTFSICAISHSLFSLFLEQLLYPGLCQTL